MGIIDNKRNVLNQLGSLTSIKDNLNIPQPNDSISSINNSKEIVPFLLDLLVVMVGSEKLKSTVGELMTGFIRKIEPKLKEELKKQTSTFNSNQQIPTSFNLTGISVPAIDIDSREKLKTDPNTQMGSLLYNSNPIDFDVKSYGALNNVGTDVTFNNLKIKFSSSSNSFTYKPVNGSQTIGEFTNDYIDGLTLINEKEFTSDIINKIFGTINTNQNKTLNQLILEEKLNKTIDKIIDEAEVIEISDDELRQIEINAQKRLDGIQDVDVGCGILVNTVTLDSLEDLIRITTGSTDPLTVGNAYVDLVAGGFAPDDETQAKEDGETIKDGFLKALINAIVSALVSSIITPPQIRALFAITSAFKNNGIPDIGDPIDDLIKNLKLINCLSDQAKALINEFLFNLIKEEMIKLIIPVSKLILKEKINQYLQILRSLIGFI